jgi:hypothetical protein
MHTMFMYIKYIALKCSGVQGAHSAKFKTNCQRTSHLFMVPQMVGCIGVPTLPTDCGTFSWSNKLTII